jgi:ElaB/YqjD/DUF883 family membrane-anchored ribosome-binding protein
MKKIVLSLVVLLLLTIVATATANDQDIFQVAEHIAQLSPNCRIRVMEIVSEKEFVNDLADNNIIESGLRDVHRESHQRIIEEHCSTSDEEKSTARKIYDTAKFPLQQFFDFMDNAKWTLQDKSHDLFKTVAKLPSACRASTFYRMMSQDWIGKFKDKVTNFADFSKSATEFAGSKFASTCSNTYNSLYDTLTSTMNRLRVDVDAPGIKFFSKFINSIQNAATNVKDQMKEDFGMSPTYQPVHNPSPVRVIDVNTIRTATHNAVDKLGDYATGLTHNIKEIAHDIKDSAARKAHEAHYPREFDRVEPVEQRTTTTTTTTNTVENTSTQHPREVLEAKISDSDRTGNTLKDDLFEAKDLIEEKAKTSFNEYKDKVTDTAQAMKKGIEDTVDSVKDKASNIKSNIEDKMVDTKDKIHEKASNIKSNIEAKVGETKDKIHDFYDNKIKTRPVAGPATKPFYYSMWERFKEFSSRLFYAIFGGLALLSVVLFFFLLSRCNPWISKKETLIVEEERLTFSEDGRVVDETVVVEEFSEPGLDKIQTDRIERMLFNLEKRLIKLENTLTDDLYDVRDQVVTTNEELTAGVDTIRNELRHLMKISGQTFGSWSSNYAEISNDLMERSDRMSIKTSSS